MDEQLHARLRAERFLSEADYQKVLDVDRKSLQVSKQLTAMRALALAHEQEMGDALFTFPQDYGSSGLLVADADLLDYDTLQVYFHRYWQAVPVGKIQSDAPLFFEKLLKRPDCDTLSLRDYYLCALLLERNLDKFVLELPSFYCVNDSLPLHYREAMVLYKNLRPEDCEYSDAEEEEQFAAFNAYLTPYVHETERRNYARRKYGRTYWYYYLYQAD